MTAKKFLAAANFLELVGDFPGEEDEEVKRPPCRANQLTASQRTQKIKYAKWKAADIAKAFKEGRTPVPGPPGGLSAEERQAETNGTATPNDLKEMDLDSKEIERDLLPSRLTAETLDPPVSNQPLGSPSYPFPSAPKEPDITLHASAPLPLPPDHAAGAVFPSAVLPSAPELPAPQELPILTQRSPSPRSPLPPLDMVPAAPMLQSKSQFSPMPITPNPLSGQRLAAGHSFAQMQQQAQPGGLEAYNPQTVSQAQKAAKFAISACVPFKSALVTLTLWQVELRRLSRSEEATLEGVGFDWRVIALAA
jgi:vacuolar protein sorting-associated protein VTA1